jgi:hypothetical protein
MALASQDKIQRQAAFLARRAGAARGSGPLEAAAGTQHVGEPLTTCQFTALHFLTDDRKRDEDVRLRFGDEVLDALRRDRKAVVRDIFGTHPYHLLPRARRVLNPYRLYQRYLAGAKFLLLPLAVFFWAARLVFTLSSQVVGLVQEVMGKKEAPRSSLPREAGFDVAARKIHRMRKPFFMEALRLRSALDIEYLGLRLPGCEKSPAIPTFREDLDFIGAFEGERRPFEKLRSAALTDLRRFRNFLAGRGWLSGDYLSALDPSGRLAGHRGEVIRALVTAYITDHGSLRSFLTAPEAAREFFEEAIARKETFRDRLCGRLAAGLRRILPSGRRRAALFAEWLRRGGEFRELSPDSRRKALRALLAAGGDTERVFSLAIQRAREEGSGADAVLEELRRVAFDYKSWTRKIIALRSLQTITVLDIRSYRDLIHAVGEYGRD